MTDVKETGRTFAVDRNYAGLMRLLALLFVYIGLADNTPHASRMLNAKGANGSEGLAACLRALAEPYTLPRRIIRRINKLLIPVESATRRLIVMIAADMPKPAALPEVKPGAKPLQSNAVLPSSGPSGPDAAPADASAPGAPVRQPLFVIGDRTPRFDGRYWDASIPMPPLDISVFNPDPVRDAEPVPTVHLMRRVAALAHAFGDLKAQAKRYQIWRLRRERDRAAGKFVNISPLKVGLPWGTPHYTVPKSKHREVHHILADTHEYAWYALRYPNDTS